MPVARSVTSDSDAFSFGEAGENARGVLLVHGFTGSQFEMRLLGEELARRGFAVDGVKLAGHASTTRALAATTWHDWYASLEEALTRLRLRIGGKRVAVVGLSMGGLLTLELARQHRDALACIGVMSAPLWLGHGADKLADAVRKRPFIGRLALPKLAGSDIRDREMKRRNAEAVPKAGMPLGALASLVELGRHLRDKLADVTTPTLLMHSESDHTVPYECMDAIANRLGTAEYRKVTLRESYHVITLDLERDRVFAAVAEWVGAYLK
jgi:carboxylesterase